MGKSLGNHPAEGGHHPQMGFLTMPHGHLVFASSFYLQNVHYNLIFIMIFFHSNFMPE